MIDASSDFHALTGHPHPPMTAATVAALAELDAWATKVLQMPLYDDQFTPPSVAIAEANIQSQERANYVAHIRLGMILQQLELIPPAAVQHPKAKELRKAISVWANKAYQAAEPGATQQVYSEE